MALGLVSTRASGLKSQFGTMGKPFNAGVAAQNGIEAALLARRGLVSRTAAVDGSQGFGPTHHGAGDMAGFEGLGRDWWMIGVRHKFHACCHGIHAALEAAGGIEAAPGEIAALEVAIHPRWLSVCNIAAPRSGLEAKFSYRVALALRLCGQDTARPGSFSDAACADPAIVALAARISVRPDERLGETQARLHLRRRDGGESLHVHDLASDPGLEARAARLRAKAVSLLGKARAARLRALIESAAAPAALAAEIGG